MESQILGVGERLLLARRQSRWRLTICRSSQTMELEKPGFHTQLWLSELAKVLKPGGNVFLQEPSFFYRNKVLVLEESRACLERNLLFAGFYAIEEFECLDHLAEIDSGKGNLMGNTMAIDVIGSLKMGWVSSRGGLGSAEGSLYFKSSSLSTIISVSEKPGFHTQLWLLELAKVLKPGGNMFLQEPSFFYRNKDLVLEESRACLERNLLFAGFYAVEEFECLDHLAEIDSTSQDFELLTYNNTQFLWLMREKSALVTNVILLASIFPWKGLDNVTVEWAY
ncbi:hypothetical protein TEA_015415 [Camellia sinensis var. sinensis]|uniref:Uncharacterized protein n=1 Tax=Camellia sinensis var. sinensis TaxID=542762 RepID=A0A4S4ENA3_CAMSN|nr:hypothetical protein TEA_015415 [Camellia sinensis var. sinensis]